MSFDPYQPPPPGGYPLRDFPGPPPGLPSRPPPPSLPPPPPPPSQSNGVDSYRPAPRDRYRDHDQGNSWRSRGGNNYDYKPQYKDNGAPSYPTAPRSYNRSPPPPSPKQQQQHHGSFNSMNPRPPQGDFTFRSEAPVGIQKAQAQAQYDGYNPRHDRPGRNRSDRRGGGGGGDRRPERYQRNFSTYSRFNPANRPMLQNGISRNDPTQDFASTDTGHTYKALEDLSDSDEAEMDISGESADEGPSKKRVRTSTNQTTSDSNVPKWSNPDPYTALPPTESGSKKKDVVHLIRKARVQPKEAGPTAPSGEEDFISCDIDSDDESGLDMTRNAAADPRHRPPTGPKADAQPMARRGKNKPPGPTEVQQAGGSNNNSRSAASAVPTTLNPPRKRTHNDQIKLPLPEHAKLKKVTKMPVGGTIAYDWRVTQGENPCPWLKDHSDTPHMGVWLHKEVVDFYEHVRPQPFEQRLREDLVEKLNKLVRNYFGDAEVHAFGSFRSGLYLPTGDMDLVMCSKAFLAGSLPKYNAKRNLWKFSNFLCTRRLAEGDEVEVISKARVPLVKYIDATTALKVDISFENTTGVKAIKTFLDWRDQYPAMPVLVTLVKHFLMMRALNEPVNGGIGGFSVICLVVSMLQLMPQVQSRDMVPEHHLGELLMHFFDLYGNKFNYETTAIRLNPPGYVPKNKVVGFTYKNPDRLSIIDPNDSTNDISGGSSNIPRIARVFSEAHKALHDRMTALSQTAPAARKNTSILSVVLEGNYSTFRLQREYLRKVYDYQYEEGPRPFPEDPAPEAPW